MMFRILVFIILLSSFVFGQATDFLKTRCHAPNPLSYASFTLQTNGVINSVTCPNGYNLFNNPVVTRYNGLSTDQDYFSGNGVDILGRYLTATGDSAFTPLTSSTLYVDSIPAGNTFSFTNGSFTTIYDAPTVATTTSLVGLKSNVLNTTNGSLHDISSGYFESIITNGRAGSGIYGIVGTANVFSPATAQDVANIVSTVNTISGDIRSFQSLWIKAPTITGAISDYPSFAIRVDNASRVPVAFLKTDGTGLGLTLSTPSSSTATCRQGEIRIDADFIYVCTATNNFKRAALSAF